MNIATHALTQEIQSENEGWGTRSSSLSLYQSLSRGLPNTGRSRDGQISTEVLIDAASVNVSLCDGILHIAPARHVTCLSLNLEECSDGAILISDELGYAGAGNMPELCGELRAIHVILGVDGDDTIQLDLRPDSPLAASLRIFNAFGEDITSTYGTLVVKRGN